MSLMKRLIAILILGLFSFQTIASVHLINSVSDDSSASENSAYFKSVISTTFILSEPNTKNQILQNPDLRHGDSSDWFGAETCFKSQFVDQRSALNNFNLFKGRILSPVNLIFPFQYFW